VLRRQGVAAWLRAWDDLGAAGAPLPATPLPPSEQPLVAVLASMALACVGGG